MKKLLFSSVLAIILMAASCGDENASEKTENPEAQMVKASSKTAATMNSGAVQKASSDDGKNQEDTLRAVEKHEAPVHGSPEQKEIDSIKASYPKKR
ncbi:MAG: hypothetical protein WEC59_13370 [Salibacteraceae bacterium]